MSLREEPAAATGPALLRLGFRPFFLGAGVFAVVSVLIWTAIYTFGQAVDMGRIPAVVWHAHAMVYGYAMAVVAGFLLTAVRNWTGVQTLNGRPLLFLFLVWAAARVLPFAGGDLPVAWLAVADILFMIGLTVAVLLPVIKVRQWKQMGVVSKLVLLLISNVLFYLGVVGVLDEGVRWGLYSGLYLIVALMLVMARRVIPFFIERGVGYSVELKNWLWLDITSLILFLAFWVTDVFIPLPGVSALLAGILFILHVVRMAGWYTHGIWQVPLLWVLYLAYGFLVAGFALKAVSPALEVSPYLSVHAFAYGGIGMMTIGMMSRVILGHTGRNILEPPAQIHWIFLLLFIGAIVRVFFPLFDQQHYLLWVGLSQVLWLVSFAGFLLVYTPMLIRPRIDGKDG